MMKISSTIICFLAFTAYNQSATATLFNLELTGTVSANQTGPGGISGCGVQNGPGLLICHYFSLGDTVSLNLQYDDSTPFYNLNSNPNHRVHDNAFTSLTLSSTSSTYSGYSGSASGQFGQFIVRDLTQDGYTFRFWESTASGFAYDTANDMDLTHLDTGLTFAADDALGDIIIQNMLINLTSLQNDLISGTKLPTSLNLNDFDNPNSTNWSFTAKNGLGFGASVGIDLTALSVTAASTTQGTVNPAPEPTILALFSIGLTGLVFIRKRKLQP